MSENLIFTLWAIGMTTLVTFFYFKGKKALKIFPSINNVKVIYRDSSASGYSTSNFKTKVVGGSIRKVLDIVVTDSELWLKSDILFVAGLQYDGMLQKIKLDSISNVKRDNKNLFISFKKGHLTYQVLVKTRNIDELMQSLKLHTTQK